MSKLLAAVETIELLVREISADYQAVHYDIRQHLATIRAEAEAMQTALEPFAAHLERVLKRDGTQRQRPNNGRTHVPLSWCHGARAALSKP